jgi:hypothetical protein
VAEEAKGKIRWLRPEYRQAEGADRGDSGKVGKFWLGMTGQLYRLLFPIRFRRGGSFR